jgi:hypothetical protein
MTMQNKTSRAFNLAVTNFIVALVFGFVSAATALPPQLANYDASGQIRFKTLAQAENKRQELIRYIWPAGLPTNTLPAAIRNIGLDVFSNALSGLDRSLAASVDLLDSEIVPYQFHGLSYLIHPAAKSTNNLRLVVINSGHRNGVAFTYGVNRVADRLLGEGFNVLMTDMPLVGFNTWHTIALPNGAGTVNIAGRETTGHNEMFAKLVPALPAGTIFRFFLEPMVQGVNYFLHTTPGAADVSYVGLSGGGWTGHMLAALDTRIKNSFPVAGSLPLYARSFSPGSEGDAEQIYAPLYLEVDKHNTNGVPDTAAGVASWLEIYALGGIGPGRHQTQILNLYDACCFSGDTFQTYTNFVSTTVRDLGRGSWDFYSDATHKEHQISSNCLENVILPGLMGTPGKPESNRLGR